MRPVNRALSAIVLLAFAVRVWGIHFGLPLTVCRPDENLVVQPALEYFGGDFDPQFYAYGTLGSYLLHALMRVQFCFEYLRGNCPDTQTFVRAALVDPGHWYLVARCLGMAAGVATIWVVHRLASELGGRTAGLCAAFLLALCFLHARDSHFGTLDVLATLFTTSSVWLAIAALRTGKLRTLLFAALCGGLAAATKYGGGLALLSVLAASLVQQPIGWRARASRFALVVLVGTLAFFAAMPYAALNSTAVLAALRTESEHLAQGGGLDLGPGWWRHLSFTLAHGMGLPLLAAALVGAWVLVRGSRPRALVFFAFPLVYFALAGSGRTVFVRYMLPLTPILCVLAGLFAARFGEALRARGRAHAGLATAGLVALLAALPAWSLLQFDRLLARADTRLEARAWLIQNAAQGSSVAQPPGFARTQLPADLETRERAFQAWSKLTSDRSIAARMERMRVPPLQELEGAGYGTRRWIEQRNAFAGDGGAPSAEPDYVVVSASPLALFDPPTPSGLARVLSERYALAASFVASDAQAVAESYDPLDQFYLPYSSFRGVARPGPNLEIWARK